MDSPETQSTLGTAHKTQNEDTKKKRKQKQKPKKATQKTKKMSNMDPTKKIGMNPDVSEVLAIPSVE